jgi:hypothetical protein
LNQTIAYGKSTVLWQVFERFLSTCPLHRPQQERTG